MTKNTLGLPLEYQERPELFDAHNVDQETDLKNSVIESLLAKYHKKTILDLTCGTGSQVFYLAKRGYKLLGADFSPALLEIAREKAEREQVDVEFVNGDMRTLKVGQFDAVITIFNAVGHLTRAGFEKALKNIQDNLCQGGIYIFDIFNLSALTDEVVANFALYKHTMVDGISVHHVQCSTLDKKNGRLVSYDNYTIQEGAGVPELFNNQFSLQLYTPQELRDLLTRNGFELLEQVDFDGSEFVENKTVSMLTVARKK